MPESRRPSPSYRVYRAGPGSLISRLRGEPDQLRLPGPPSGADRAGGPGGPGGPGSAAGPGGDRFAGSGRDRFGLRGSRRLVPRRVRPRRVIRWLAIALAGWVALSVVLFLISSGQASSSIPDSATAALQSGPNMLTGTDTVLVLGTDQRPAGTHEGGANTKDAGSNSDTIMLWRIGGGTSRRLSIPRDTVAEIPGHGLGKINAGYAIGGPALAIKTIERFTGVPINHLIVVNLGAFPPFIDAIGGVDVTTGRVCSDISGGTKNGGFSLYLPPGTHHLDGRDALTLARTRHNKCNPAENDLTRVKRQQQILNGVKSQLFSLSAFLHLPWASWDAPKVLRTDMGGPTLLTLFTAAEIGGAAPPTILKPTGAETLPGYGSALTVTHARVQQAVAKLMGG